MNYRSTKETAELWNLSARRITVLASSGRIPGAKLVGKTWLIPEDAVKPEDARYKKENLNEDDYFFPLPVYIYDAYTAEQKLSPSQFELFKAQKLCISGNFAEAEIILNKILNSTNNICMILGAIYFKTFTDLFFNNQESLLQIYARINKMNLSQVKYSDELALILLDIKGILSGNAVYMEGFKLNRNYNYSSESLPYLVLMETYTSLITAYTSGGKLKPMFQESVCIYMKQNNCIFSEITLHIYLAMMYKTNDDLNNYLFHIQNALTLAEKNEIILPFLMGFKFFQNDIMNYVMESNSAVFKKIPEVAQIFLENSERFFQSKNINKVYYNLSSDELNLIENARFGLTNKEIAKIMKISESYVSKKYFELCRKTGASSKKELVEMFIENMKL